MKTLLAYRNFSGIGDWLMGLTVLKMVNQQYPDIEITLNMTAKNVHKGQKQYKVVPEIIRELVKSVDVKISNVIFYENVKTYANEYDYISNLKYRKRENIFFIESMINNFNKFTKLKLKYDPSIYAQYQGKPENPIKEPYILVQACSKRTNYNQTWKDYGINNMQKVINHLSDKFTIYQVGGKEGPTLDGAKEHFRELPLKNLHSVMANCQAFVGLDGFLGCFAAHHGITQYIIYSGSFNMAWTNFPHRVQLNGNKLSPQQVSDAILPLINQKVAANA
jgi:ADP-heptose:LPS heptosyltransferase